MRFYNIFFSPTGGTEKVADIVAKGTKLDAEEIDLIKEPDKLMKVKFEKKDLCLVAVPSYGGRIPSVVTDIFRKVKADGTKAILVAVFGNRMIDDTLLELQDVLEASGFVCIAGMEAVAEHSPMHQFEPDARISRMKRNCWNLPQRLCKTAKHKGHLHFRETDHIENTVVFHSNLLQMENALPAICAQKNARQVPFRWTIRR